MTYMVKKSHLFTQFSPIIRHNSYLCTLNLYHDEVVKHQFLEFCSANAFKK